MTGLRTILTVVVLATAAIRSKSFSTVGRSSFAPCALLTSKRSMALASSSSQAVAAGLQERLMSGSKSRKSDEELEAISLETISFKNTQKKFPVDEKRVLNQIAALKRILGVPEFQVDVWFCSEAKIRELNEDWRDKRKSTDILSFPANDFEAPGIFAEDPSLEFEKHLGDLVVAPAYVARQCERDQKDFEGNALDDSEDAGVSKAMSTVFSLEDRMPLLLTHGIIHLLGYDHENNKDWKEMTTKEEQVLAQLSEFNTTGKITVLGPVSPIVKTKSSSGRVKRGKLPSKRAAAVNEEEN